MKRLLPITLLFSSLLLTGLVNGQVDRFAYAVTDVVKEGANWSYLRMMNLKDGSFSDVLLKGNDASLLSYDAATKKQISTPLKDERLGNWANAAFGTGVAAIAYDKKNNRLYYTPMFLDQLRYIDLKSMKVYFVTSTGLTGTATKAADQSNIITRMSFASDGNGYALTNDGTHLVRFTTGKKVTVSDLGALVDDPANKTVSVHNSCTSFGGDMIADDDGHLYVFSARNHIFQINIENKVATHLGAITDLPANFTVNGAVVNDNNQILVTSAVNGSNSYVVDIKSLKASPAVATSWKTADLANSNLLITRKATAPLALLTAPENLADGKVSVFPNPAPNKQFSMQFTLPEGNYSVQITDAMGRQVHQSTVYIKAKGQIESLQMPESTKSGMYLVKVIDNSKTVFTQKLLIQ